MSNIPYLAAHLEKRAGKEESFDIINRSIKGDQLTDHDWAVLYSYFLPPKPKKITNPYEWVSMVCDQKESYAFCKYVLVDGLKVTAANTKTAHILFDDLGLSPGWHDIKKGKAGNDIAVMPNIDQAVSESDGNDYCFDINDFNSGSFSIVDTPAGLSYVLPWINKGVDKKYFDLMIKSLSGISVTYSIDGPFKVTGVINGIKCAAIIMPFKLNGFSGELSPQDTVSVDEEAQLSF